MIWAIIPVWLKRALAWAAAVLVAIGGAWAIGRSDGARGVEAKAAEKAADDLAKAKDARDAVDNLSGDDVGKRLSKWTRD